LTIIWGGCGRRRPQKQPLEKRRLQKMLSERKSTGGRKGCTGVGKVAIGRVRRGKG